MAFTQELERRNVAMVQLQPNYQNTNVATPTISYNTNVVTPTIAYNTSSVATPITYNNNAAVHLMATAVVEQQQQQIIPIAPQQTQSSQTPQPRYPGNYYQGATISEIDDSVGSSETTLMGYTSTTSCTSVQTHSGLSHHPQAVQASPVLVLHGVAPGVTPGVISGATPGVNHGHHDITPSSNSNQQRHKLRQKALVDSVESKV